MPSTLVTPLLIYRPFGTNAANPTYINLPIPDASQTGTTINAASFADGFPPATMTPEVSGGLPFFGQDMNGILWMISAYAANFAAGALSSYDATLSTAISGYPAGAILVASDAEGMWINQLDGNTANPDTSTGVSARWYPFGGIGTTPIALSSVDVTVTNANAKRPHIALSGTLTSNVNVILPAFLGQSWIVANSCTGAHTVTVKTPA